jgi:pilus assembly protein Flp/PilA
MNTLTLTVMQGVIATRLWLRDRISSDRGASAVEYGLLVGLIAVVIAGVVLLLGTGLHSIFDNTQKCVANPGTTTVLISGANASSLLTSRPVA